MRIQLTQKSRINNPLDFKSSLLDNRQEIFRFEGQFDQEIFCRSDLFLDLRQKNNFEKINKRLKKINLEFEYIWIGCYKCSDNSIVTNFVIKTGMNENNEAIFWQKYKNEKVNTVSNKIHLIDNQYSLKFKINEWLSYIDSQ